MKMFEFFDREERKGGEKVVDPAPFRENDTSLERLYKQKIEKLEARVRELEEENRGLRRKAGEYSPDGFTNTVFLNENLSLGFIVIDGIKKPAVNKGGVVVRVKDHNATINVPDSYGLDAYLWDDKKEKWVLN